MALAAAVACASALLDRAGISPATIVAALAAGMVVALRWPGRIAVRRPLATTAQCIIGIALGQQLGGGSLSALATAWPAVVVVTLSTLVAALALGALLQRSGRMDASTATLAMVPSGALGIVAMTRSLGGDDRIVAFSQYLRVLAMLAATPLIAAAIGPAPAGPARNALPVEAVTGLAPVLSAGGFGLVGWVLARAVRVPTPALLGPLVVCGAIAILVPDASLHLPAILRETAFGLVGLDVGLRFTRESFAHARRILPALMWTLAALLSLCFGLAAAMSVTTSMGLLDAYLVSAPGGLAVVAATAYGTGANIALVVAAQGIRMVVTMLLAPLAVRFMVRVLHSHTGASASCQAQEVGTN